MQNEQLKIFVRNLILSLGKTATFDKHIRIKILSETLIRRVGLKQAIYFAAQYFESTLLITLLRMSNKKKNKYLFRALYFAAINNRQDNIAVLNQAKIDNIDAVMAGAAAGGHLSLVQRMLDEGARLVNWAMVEAAKNGHPEIVDIMIKRKAWFISEMIEVAVASNNLPFIEWLIEQRYIEEVFLEAFEQDKFEIMLMTQRAKPTIIAWSKFLFAAAKHGRLDLLKSSESLSNFTDKELAEILVAAIKGQHLDVVLYLLNRCHTFNRTRVIIEAIKTNNKAIVSPLLAHFETAFIFLGEAAEVGDKDFVERFFIEAYRQTILDRAAIGGHIDLVKQFFVETYRYTVLDRAVVGGHIELVKFALQKEFGISQETLLKAVRDGKVAIFEMLAARGVDSWNAVLVEACKCGQKEIARQALDRGADIVDASLIVALEQKRYDTLDLLRDELLSVESRLLLGVTDDDEEQVSEAIICGAKEYNTAAITAARLGSVNVLPLLTRATTWRKILYTAAEHNQLEVVKFLIDKRLVVDTKILRPAYRRARQNGGIETADYIFGCLL